MRGGNSVFQPYTNKAWLSPNAMTNTTVNTACSQDDYISGGIKNNDYRF